MSNVQHSICEMAKHHKVTDVEQQRAGEKHQDLEERFLDHQSHYKEDVWKQAQTDQLEKVRNSLFCKSSKY